MATIPSAFAGGGNASLTVPVTLASTGINTVFGAQTTGDTVPRVQMAADGAIRFGPGNAATDTTLFRSAAGVLSATAVTSNGLSNLNNGVNVSNGFVDVQTAGFGVAVKEGTNAKQGTAVLVAGTVTVSNTSVTASSRIMLTTQTPGGTAGFLVVSARVAGTSFTILSSNAADTSTVAYEIFEPG